MALAQLERQRCYLREQIRQEKQRHEKELDYLKSRLNAVNVDSGMEQRGFDSERINKALEMVKVAGSFERGGEDRHSALNDAISDIAHGGKIIVREFFGTKNYAQWGGQRCDCEYGMGPRHGAIVFAIGLRDEYRKSLRRHDGFYEQIPEEDRDTMIYFLRNLEEYEAICKQQKGE